MTKESHWEKYFVDYFDPSDYLEDAQYEKYAKEAAFTKNSYAIETVRAWMGMRVPTKTGVPPRMSGSE